MLAANVREFEWEIAENFETERLLAIVRCALMQPAIARDHLQEKLNRVATNAAAVRTIAELLAQVDNCCEHSTPFLLDCRLNLALRRRFLGGKDRESQTLQRNLEVMSSFPKPTWDSIVMPSDSNELSGELPKSHENWPRLAYALRNAGWHSDAARLFVEIIEYYESVTDSPNRRTHYLELAARELVASGRPDKAKPYAARNLAAELADWEARGDIITRWKILAIERYMNWVRAEEAELRFLVQWNEDAPHSDDLAQRSLELAEFLRDRGRFEEALPYAKSAWEVTRKHRLLNEQDQLRFSSVYPDILEELKYRIAH
jgi:tetratricopeptide (TPR) repeat protein